MPALKTYDLFISHAWTYTEVYAKLVDFLNAAPFFAWRNYSVPKTDPLTGGSAAKLTSELDRQIRPVNCVLIIGGMYVSYRDWIQKEIDIARSYNKPIVGIRPWGSQMMPQAVTQAAREIVGWNTASIVDAVRRHSI
ncbi:conserved protein of unknown function(containing MTH538 TIR-like domain,7-113) [Magnetospirillum sp. XM-1]|uniref:TIR domain-containing protein n=1 Tax=unclassified Magnetospirillum TaxID=2617991 RepID=UPI00073DE412|nr:MULTISPECIES: TIR domain-containing protein [unclassified Magnetospirillum]ARJ65649.1 nuclease [Magnetospirillum sp. ME-1]CUW40075.1 conserved protein of unknown function(containing MTH538 TIR-like domain,7-113) [Magnetospirillum sp. XM-1]